LRSGSARRGCSRGIDGRGNAPGGGSCHLRRTCAVDLDALCAGVTLGEGRVRACLMAHTASMSTFCSAKLSREIYLATDAKRT
jgi:hypothetical protein